jgi:hypothetical protein
MDESDIPRQVGHGRRRFLCAVPAVPALAVGAAELGMTGSAEAKADRTRRAGRQLVIGRTGYSTETLATPPGTTVSAAARAPRPSQGRRCWAAALPSGQCAR